MSNLPRCVAEWEDVHVVCVPKRADVHSDDSVNFPVWSGREVRQEVGSARTRGKAAGAVLAGKKRSESSLHPVIPTALLDPP